jgi:hypothetical protein
MSKKRISLFLIVLLISSTLLIAVQLPYAAAMSSPSLSDLGYTETTVTLEWSAVSPDFGNSIENYIVYLSTTGVNGPYSNYSTGYTSDQGTLYYTFYGLNPDTNYWFYVQAVEGNLLGSSYADSNTREVTTSQVPLLSYSSVTQTTVSLNWVDYNDYSSFVSFQSYTIQMMPSSGSWSMIATITSQSETSYTVTGLSSGDTYYFRVFDSVSITRVTGAFSSYSNTISVQTVAPLSVTISAFSTSVNVGQTIIFTSNVAGGVPPYSYQWYVNGNTVSGATSSSYTFSSNSPGTYSIYLKVTDSSGTSESSNDITITVNPPLSVAITSSASSVDVGSSLKLTSQVSGGVSPYVYQWYVNDNPSNSATSSSFSFDPVSAGTYSIYLVVTDSTGLTKDSNSLSITVFPALNFTASATFTAINNGSSSTFSVNPSGGNPPYSYQWYVNGAPVSGATSSTFTFKPASIGNYTVYVVVKDSTGISKDSNIITLTVSKSTTPLGSLTIPVLAIIVIIIVVIVAVVAVVLASRRNKQRRNQEPKTSQKPPNS